MANDDDRRDNRGVPLSDPDPTKVTTEQIDKAILQFDKGIASLHALLQSELQGIENVRDEKFNSVNARLDQGEAQRVEQKIDTRLAVDAALAAAKEAVKEQTAAFALATAKSEAGTAEQLKQLTVTFTAAIDNLTTSLGEVKDRIGRVETFKLGGDASVSDQRLMEDRRRDRNGALAAYIVGAVGATTGIVLAITNMIP